MTETNEAAQPEPAKQPNVDGDYLGYGVYADALWARIENALAKDTITGKLGDDPMVVGLFGEWGAGKSYLLGLMQDRSKDWAKKRIGWRALGGGSAGLTVPVLFQPWKYEREEHLHVPLMMHIFSALQHYEKQAQTLGDKFGGMGADAWEGVKKGMPVLVGLFEKILKASIAVAEPLVATGTSVGLGLAKGMASSLKPRGPRPADPLKIYKYSDDGRFFYDMHEALKSVTRPTYDNGQLRTPLSYPLSINFVVFIDDLDRCLPEKAVQTLEMIKTIFNVESFAFVLALDDEVIERGIGHRYQAYNFAGKKPEMPITGFEYLEKIVHLPFKLPALTRAQAKTFIERSELKIAQKNLLWFKLLPDSSPIPNAKFDAVRSALEGQAKSSKNAEFSDEKFSHIDTTKVSIFDLCALALDAFDAYVPRKLLRLVELWHTTVNIAALRHQSDPRKHALIASSSAQVDIRIALTVMMVQLFHPDLYRVFRRHEETFKTLYNSFDSAAKLEDKLSASMSDIDLWHWAAYKKSTTNKPTELKAVLVDIAALDDGYRYDAQQKRLPLVERLIEHRQAQRHVFDALKLFASLKKQMPALPENFSIAQYFSLLTEFDEFLTPLPELGSIPMQVVRGEITIENKRFAVTDAEVLYASVIAADPNTQKDMAKNAQLQLGLYLQSQDVQTLSARVKVWLDEAQDGDKARRQLQLLNGLQYLAAYIAPPDADQLWELVENIANVGKLREPFTDINQVKHRALWADVRHALGFEDRFDGKTLYGATTEGDKPRPGVPLYLPKEHFEMQGKSAEPIPGFIHIPAGTFKMGQAKESDNLPRDITIEKSFYIARYLTTVDQYASFVDDGGYKQDKLWDAQGIEWREGLFDSKVKDESYRQYLARRTPDLRKSPMDWDAQRSRGSRPVMRVSWFEARAYTRWLQDRLSGEGTNKALFAPNALLTGYKVCLPTEAQWERAAKAKDLVGSDPQRIWPWEGDDKSAHLKANIASSKLGQASVVGLFESNSVGVHDMAGNLWEWQDNLWDGNGVGVQERLPKGKELKSLEDAASSDRPALRGGSWDDAADNARCSIRLRNHPGGWDYDVGFRVVLSLA